MAIKTEMLRYFIEVAETGNLSKAAERLGRTPSAVSMMLKQLEENLGAPLFETDRKNRLTDLGTFALEEARREIAHFEQTLSAIHRFAESGEGQVRVACLPALSHALMPGITTRIHEANPKILVRIRDMLTNASLLAVREQTVDIGIVNQFMISGFSNIKSAPLLSDVFGILCLRDSALGRKETLYWSDVASDTLIVNDLCYSINDPAVRKAVTDSHINVESALTIKAFIRAGAGISIVPGLVGTDLEHDLVFRIPEGPEFRRTAYLVWNENNHPSPAVTRFCNLLRQTVADLGLTPTKDDIGRSRDWPGSIR